MSDTVMVPRVPTEAMIDAGRSEFMSAGPFAFRRFWDAMLAASTPVGGPSNLQKVQSATPPSVSTGSRPQEAVPTEQAAPPVLADERLIWFLRVIEGAGGEAPAGDGYNVLGAFCDDRGDDDDTYNVSESLGYTRTMHSGWGDGCASVSITDAGRAVLSAPTPQPADGCSSNEGAGQ